jgi:hypothetical protein
MPRISSCCGSVFLTLVGIIVFGSVAPCWAEGVASPESSFAIASDADDANALLAQAPTGKKTAPAPAANQPATPSTTEQTPPSDFLSDIYGRTAASEMGSGLAGTPNMFGDSYGGNYSWESGNGMFVSGSYGDSSANTPLAGGNRRMKIAENGNTLPQDRVYFLYNHFQDAASISDATVTPGLERSISLDRYTIGFEKTFRDGLWAFELRMPFGCGYGYQSAEYSSFAGQIGNLDVVLKRLLYKSETTAAAIGLCVDTPTGSDATGMGQGVEYKIHNQATFLSPYLGILRTPNDKLFYQAFLQLDVPTNGNRIDYVDTLSTSSGTFGTLHDQILMYADLSVGYWLSRNPGADWVTGLASVLELHYTTTTQDADIVSGTAAGRYFSFGNFGNRVDVLDLTFGLHAELVNHTLCRVAGVVPLRTGDNRLFNSEVQVQLERRF